MNSYYLNLKNIINISRPDVFSINWLYVELFLWSNSLFWLGKQVIHVTRNFQGINMKGCNEL
jgi:hypothetical protein